MSQEEQELKKLEDFLRTLPPAEPGEALTARIFSAFDTPSDAAPAEVGEEEDADFTPPISLDAEARNRSWFQPFAAAAAVTLIAGIVALIGLNRPAEPPEPARFVPSYGQNTYHGSNVDGIVYTEDRHPLQAVRHQIVSTYTWENPEDGSRVEVQVPVERIRYVPVQTD